MAPAVFVAMAQTTALGLPIVAVEADGARCPASRQVEAAITQQLPSDRGAGPGWTVRYAAVGSDAISLEVVDGGGVVRARRRVTTSAQTCASAAKTVAAIVMRAYSPVEWSPTESADSSIASVDQPPTLARTNIQSTFPRLTLALGPALLTTPTTHANLLIDAGVRVRGRFSLRFGGTVIPSQRSESVGRQGSATMTEVGLFAGGTWLSHHLGLTFEAGPALAVAIDSAHTEALSEPDTGRRATLRGGLLLGAAQQIAQRWRVGLLVTLLAQIAGPDFSVAGANGDQITLRPAPLSVLAALRVEGALLP